MTDVTLQNQRTTSAQAVPVRLDGTPLLLGCAALTLLILGYHPYAEDGGIYTAAIAARLVPGSFPLEHVWVHAQTRFTLFVPLVAVLLNMLRFPLEGGLIALKIVTVVATLAAVRNLAQNSFASRASGNTAMLVFSVCAGLPVAGTSLYLLDPYLTARSFTTPLLLWAMAFGVQRRWMIALILCAAATSLHPLMAFWGAVPIVFLYLAQCRSSWPWLAAVPAVLLVSFGVLVLAFSVPDPPLIHSLALSRGYWFLSQWRWYEIFGAIAPPVILLAVFGKGRSSHEVTAPGLVTFSCCYATVTALLVSICFVHEGSASSIVARVQPLRTLHSIFAIFIALIAGWASQHLQSRRDLLFLLPPLVLIASAMLWMQQTLYSASSHLELPGLKNTNKWLQAFQWIRENTPQDALFAIDADYIDTRGEDAQGFRAAALRSVLPDKVKDGGIASVVPELAEDWRTGVAAQTGLEKPVDTVHIRRLKELGATWIVLQTGATAHLQCAYRNTTVSVCRLP